MKADARSELNKNESFNMDDIKKMMENSNNENKVTNYQ